MEMIVACDFNGVIGIDNSIPWYIPEDLKNFKLLTNNHILVMGRKTFESLPNGPLKNRIHIVLSNSMKNYHNNDKVIITNLDNVNNVINNVKKDKKVFVIGGNEIYNLFFDKCSKFHLTFVCKKFNGDTHLDCLDKILKSKLINSTNILRYQDIPYYFLTYSK